MRRGLSKFLKGDKKEQAAQHSSASGSSNVQAVQQQPQRPPLPQNPSQNTSLAPPTPGSGARGPSPAPSHGDVFRDRGLELSGEGDFEGAIAMYNSALKSQPSDPTALLYRSFAHVLRSNPRLDLAAQDADSIIQLDPSNWKAWKQKGDVLRRQGDLQAAVDALTNAVGCAHGIDRMETQALLNTTQTLLAQQSDLPPPQNVLPQTPPAPLPNQAPPTVPTIPPTVLPERPKKVPETDPLPQRPLPQQQTAGSTSSQPATQSPVSNPSIAQEKPTQSRSTELDESEPAPAQFITRANTGNQPVRQPQVARTHNAQTVTQTPNAPALPFGGEDLMNAPPPNEPPPGYSPPTPMTMLEVNRRLDQLTVALATKNKGSLNIRPYTTADSIDAIQLLYVGMVQGELTQREVARPTYLHTTFNSMVVDNYGYPGSTWLDMDPESSAYYEGKIPGTVGISGYSEEYRTHQLTIQPLLNLSLEGSTAFREIDIDTVVSHIRRVQLRPNTEDDESLCQIFGLSQIERLQWGFGVGGTRQKRIDSICLALNRSLYFHPSRFVDFAKSRNFSQHTLGNATQGIGMQSFLFQILIGAELLIRLRKEPLTTSWKGIVTDNISALLVLSSLWMQHVTMQGPKEGTHRYLIYAHDQQRHSEALIRFAEAIGWPYMDEARNYIENAYTYLTSGSQSVGFDICDWIYGLILPGKIFRHRIMSCLVYASPTVRSLNAAPYFENGLIVENKSYWPKRTVLARVLGGLRNPKAICGWIGPFPAPTNNITGWVRLNARRVDVPTPVVQQGDALAHFGFDPGFEDNNAMIESITNPSEWIQLDPPNIPITDQSRSLFKSLDLTLMPPAAGPPTINDDLPQEEYRASLNFEVNGTAITYTLYANPIFIAAPPCVGTHTMHRRQAQKYADNTVRVPDLKNQYPTANQLIVINAMAQGEEAVARAWCAERARHAIVRRGEGCCYACACTLATAEKGLNCNVLIWTR